MSEDTSRYSIRKKTNNKFYINKKNNKFYIRKDGVFIPVDCVISYGADQYDSNSANYLEIANWGNNIKISSVGTNGNSSFFETYDQNGNVWEWTEGSIFGGDIGSRKVLRGGGYGTKLERYLRRGYRSGPDKNGQGDPTDKLLSPDHSIRSGFRVCCLVSESSNSSNFKIVEHLNNPVDVTGFGSVNYAYRISKYLVTNDEYVQFLNSVASTDPYGLFDTSNDTFYGITRSGNSGNYTYAVKSDMGNKPVVRVSWFMAARYCNWLHNNTLNITETGSYDLNGITSFDGLNDAQIASLVKMPGAKYWIPTENEWFKAAYYKPDLTNIKSSSAGGITVSLNSTGSDILPGNSGRDNNWQVVALPNSIESSETLPYSSYVLDTIPSVWLGQSMHLANVEERANGFRNALWITPSSTYDAFYNNLTYNVIFSGNINASDSGNAYVSFSSWGDNKVEFYLGGDIIGTNTENPTINNGIKIFNPGSSPSVGGGIFSGVYPVVSGNNPIFAVVTDFAPGGAVGLLVSNLTIDYVPFATQYETAPCSVKTLSNGDGVGSDFVCLTGTETDISFSQNPNDSLVVFFNNPLNNDDIIYFTQETNLPTNILPYYPYRVVNREISAFQIASSKNLSCDPIVFDGVPNGTNKILYNGQIVEC